MAFVSDASRSASLADRVTRVLEEAKLRYAKWQLYRETRDELMSLGDRELADLGIARSAIRGIAYRTAYK